MVTGSVPVLYVGRMHICGNFLILAECGTLAGARIVYVFVEVVSSLWEWLLACSESCIACRVWHLYVYVEGCAIVVVKAYQLHWKCYDNGFALTSQLCAA